MHTSKTKHCSAFCIGHVSLNMTDVVRLPALLPGKDQLAHPMLQKPFNTDRTLLSVTDTINLHHTSLVEPSMLSLFGAIAAFFHTCTPPTEPSFGISSIFAPTSTQSGSHTTNPILALPYSSPSKTTQPQENSTSQYFRQYMGSSFWIHCRSVMSWSDKSISSMAPSGQVIESE